MKKAPYEKFSPGELILRDHLAVDRTALANERTFLAYARTALTLFLAGVTFIKFFDTPALTILGWAFLPLGVGTFAFGLYRFRSLSVRIKKTRGLDMN